MDWTKMRQEKTAASIKVLHSNSALSDAEPEGWHTPPETPILLVHSVQTDAPEWPWSGHTVFFATSSPPVPPKPTHTSNHHRVRDKLCAKPELKGSTTCWFVLCHKGSSQSAGGLEPCIERTKTWTLLLKVAAVPAAPGFLWFNEQVLAGTDGQNPPKERLA